MGFYLRPAVRQLPASDSRSGWRRRGALRLQPIVELDSRVGLFGTAVRDSAPERSVSVPPGRYRPTCLPGLSVGLGAAGCGQCETG